ncbi:MAG: alpha/beta hydrolase [Gammaproteobacteria bacterium]
MTPRISIPDDIDGYLASSESQFDDIVDGAEKTVIWRDPLTRTRTPLALIYLHGFTASRQEIAPVPERVAEALGANLFYTRLAGHGRSGDALGSATLADWLCDCAEALEIGRRIGDRIVIMGTSTGGTLAIRLAVKGQTELADALVLISPNFGPLERGAETLTWPGARWWAPLIEGEYRCAKPHNELHRKYTIPRYHTRALIPMMELVKTTRAAPVQRISIPTLVVYSRNDTIVDPAQTEAFFRRLGSPNKQLIEFHGADDPQQHVLGGDIVSPSGTQPLADVIVGFIREDVTPAEAQLRN